MNFLENLNFANSEKEILDDRINYSPELNDLAHELRTICLQNIANYYIDENIIWNFSEIMNIFSILFNLIKESSIYNKNVFLVTSNYLPYKECYFLLGNYNEIKQKLIDASKDQFNLRKNDICLW